MAKECNLMIKMNTKKWHRRREDELMRREDEEREDRILKAGKRKEEYQKKQQRKQNQVKITELLRTLPRETAREIEQEERRRDSLELSEIKKSVWKRRREKKDTKGMLMKIPSEDEKIEAKLRSLRQKVEEYREQKEEEELVRAVKMSEKQERLRRNRETKDKWDMMKWLSMYIEANKYAWEQRRVRQEEYREEEEKIKAWSMMSKEEKIQLLKTEEEEGTEEETKRKEKAQYRRVGWKTWRKTGSEAEGGDDRVKHESLELRNTLPNEGDLVNPEGLIQTHPTTNSPKLKQSLVKSKECDES